MGGWGGNINFDTKKSELTMWRCAALESSLRQGFLSGQSWRGAGGVRITASVCRGASMRHRPVHTTPHRQESSRTVHWSAGSMGPRETGTWKSRF